MVHHHACRIRGRGKVVAHVGESTDPTEAHRHHEGKAGEHQRCQADGDRHAREEDGAAGGFHGSNHRCLSITLGRFQLLTEAVDDEQRVVDRYAEAEEHDDQPTEARVRQTAYEGSLLGLG